VAKEPRVVSVNISSEKGTAKHPVERIIVDERGIEGDAHSGAWHRQVSVLALERIEQFGVHVGRAIRPGEFAENLTVHGIDLRRVSPLDRFVIGEVDLEVTQVGKSCHGDTCAIYREVGQCLMPREGLFCRVRHGGVVASGDPIEHVARPLRMAVITLSDRAAAGQYEDKSGPRLAQLLESHFAGTRWRLAVDRHILADDATQLHELASTLIRDGVDAVFTTGGTGIGPRDIAPETVGALCEKMLPGIMEYVRVAFGGEHPGARLSRGVAGVCGTTQLYTLPGSVRAVEEYLGEILKTFEHVVFTLHGIDRH